MQTDRKLYETWLKQEGAKLYQSFDATERQIMRFGMLPAKKMFALQERLWEDFEAQTGRKPMPQEKVDMARLLVVGCNSAANAGPEPLVV